MLSVIMLSVMMLSVIMLSVVAPNAMHSQNIPSYVTSALFFVSVAVAGFKPLTLRSRVDCSSPVLPFLAS